MSRKLPVISDEQFQRGEVPMTKQEIRLFVMAQAMVEPEEIVWDIGAGTGSLSVEAAFRASRGQVFALDGDAEACALVYANAKKFSLENITVLHGKAPEALKGLPDPDVVFVGGSGGNLTEILSTSASRLKQGGRLLITAVLVETLHDTLRFMDEQNDFRVESCGLQVTRIRPVGGRHMFQSLNSVYVVTCRKGECL